MKSFILSFAFLLSGLNFIHANNSCESNKTTFLGMWTISIEDGTVGWINIHEDKGFLDAELLWKGGSVLPVSHIYQVDENTMVVTRTSEINKTNKGDGNDRKHIMSYSLRMDLIGDHIVGHMSGPRWGGDGESIESFIGTRLPEITKAPNLNEIKYGPAVNLFNGKDLTGWEIINPNHKNGFKALNGQLLNEPIQPSNGEHIYYGNLRTKQVFKDFNLTLQVNVPEGNNSGIYLRGMYEIQVFDSYGKDLDSHHMGAVYSRVAPTIAAEKPSGSWQSLDITLYKRHVTVILNGKKIIDNQPVYGPTGGAIIADVFAPGPIYLQGDHGNVAYRNIILKPIL